MRQEAGGWGLLEPYLNQSMPDNLPVGFGAAQVEQEMLSA